MGCTGKAIIASSQHRTRSHQVFHEAAPDWLMPAAETKPRRHRPLGRGEGSSGVFVIKDARCARTGAIRRSGVGFRHTDSNPRSPGMSSAAMNTTPSRVMGILRRVEISLAVVISRARCALRIALERSARVL